jgi:hypothetical protein
VLERLLGGGEAHKYKVAMAADLVALWHNGRITVDARTEEISAAALLKVMKGG